MKKTISPKLKIKILEESKRSGCVISELAKQYGIKADRIYRWRLKDSREKSSLSNEVRVACIFLPKYRIRL